MRCFRLAIITLFISFALNVWIVSNEAEAVSGAELTREAESALQKLYARMPSAEAIAKRAKGILIFPSIVKGGFLVGGQYGEGILLINNKHSGYYNTVQMSYGFQAGLQEYGYAMFFMTNSGLSWLNRSNGWEIGAGPSIVVMDEGMARTITSTTVLQSDVYTFFFDQKGLMGGMGIQGTKITRISK